MTRFRKGSDLEMFCAEAPTNYLVQQYRENVKEQKGMGEKEKEK